MQAALPIKMVKKHMTVEAPKVAFGGFKFTSVAQKFKNIFNKIGL